MNKEDLVRDLATRFESKKSAFLAELREIIASYIRSQGKNCLALVEQQYWTDGSEKIWHLEASGGYVKRLIAFCQEKKVDGHQLDSGLTKPIVERVTKSFEQLYESNSSEISGAVLQFILNDRVLNSALTKSIAAAVAHPTAEVRDRVTAYIVDQIRVVIQSSSGHAVAGLLAKSVAASVSKPVATKVAALIIKVLSTHLKGAVAKVLAASALKGAIAVCVKKFVVTAVAAAIVKAIAAKFGISTFAAFGVVLIPIIAGYIAYQVSVFPEHLGDKVSERVVSELSGRFSEINVEVMDKVVSFVVGAGIGELFKPLTESPEVAQALKEALRELEGG